MAKKESQFGVIEGVLAYCTLAQPKKKYQSNDTEYSISIIVNEDVADEWDGQFKKQPAKKIRAADFEEVFKMPLPEALSGEKNVYRIQLKKDAVVGGEAVFPEFRPKVLLETEEERIDITESRLVANGSYGKVSYRITSNDFGTFARLNNVLIQEEDFVEYESSGSSGAGSEFGSSKPTRKEPAKHSVTNARQEQEAEHEEEQEEKPAEVEKKAPAKKPVKQEEDWDSSEVPF